MKNRRVSFLVAVAVCTAAPAVHAETKAWTAAKKVLPADLEVVGGFNWSNIKTSSLFQQFFPMLLAQKEHAQEHLDKIKSDCGIDVLGAVDSVVIGAKHDDGVIIVALKGTNHAAIDACAQKIATSEKKKLTITTKGDVSTYAGFGDKPVYMKWLGTDTVAIGGDTDAMLGKLTGGIAGDKTFSSKDVKTDAGIWGVVHKSAPLDDFKTTMNGAYGSANFTAGAIDVNIHVAVANAADATKASSAANTKLADARKSVPMFAAMLQSVLVKSAGPEVVITAKLAEKDVQTMLGMAMGMAGGVGSTSSTTSAPPMAAPPPPPPPAPAHK